MRFIEDDKKTQSDLPWASEYLSSIGQEYDISFIEEIVPVTKGLMVIAKDFKGFLFRDSKVYNHIMEATDNWKDFPQPGFAIFARVLPSGKIDIAIDDDSDGIFTVDKRKKVTQKLKKDSGELVQTDSNPFIRQATLVPTTKRKVKDTTESSIGH